MFSFLWWLVIGLVAGGLARLVMPGEQRMGLMLTMVLGLVGSLIGGFVSSVVFGYSATDGEFHAGGLVMSTLGAILVLGIYLWARRDRTITR